MSSASAQDAPASGVAAGAGGTALSESASGGLAGGVRHFLLALQFFTRLPLPGRLMAWVGFSPAMMRAAAGHFPGVGWVVGSVSALVLWLALTCLLPSGVMLPVALPPLPVETGAVVPGAAQAALPALSVATGVAVGGAGGNGEGGLALWLVASLPAMVGGLLVSLVAVLLSLMASVWLTGAFHEDGLADVGDALGGFAPKAQALRIMKDSRLGTYGVITLSLVLLLKISLLWLLVVLAGPSKAMMALVGVHVLSRGAPLCLVRWLRYVGAEAVAEAPGEGGEAQQPLAAMISVPETPAAMAEVEKAGLETTGVAQTGASKSRSVAEDISGRTLLVAALWCLPALGLIGAGFGLRALLAVCVVGGLLTWQLGRIFRWRLGGVTGDCLGATQQLVEVGAYLVLAWAVLANIPAGAAGGPALVALMGW
ncbi:MAG: adenosylcobinamide-GDP ribazoletransferase [Lautropia sp.]|nr:adenosylcobinamide-GDP ribazoletransferase [Lautropia sp.]